MKVIATEFVVRTKAGASEKVRNILDRNAISIVKERSEHGDILFNCRADKDGEAAFAEFEVGKIPVTISAD